MSEQQSEPTSAETVSVSAASDAGTATEPVMTESPAIAPDQELTSPKADAPKVEARIDPKIEPKIEAAKVEAPKADVKAEKKPDAPRPSGNVTIMSPAERRWSGDAKAAKPSAPMSGPMGRVAAMVAVITLAAVAGAVGGALATSDLRNGKATDVAAARNVGFDAVVARIEADIVALKASVEQNAKLGVTQFNKASDRLDKVEKAQAEPAARLARLSDEVGKLRAAQAAAIPPAAAPVAAVAAPAQPAAPVHVAAVPATTTVPKDVTGSVAPPAAAANEPAKVEVGRLPTVEGWVLRDVGHGGALIENRRGLFEVFAGDSIPGVGRVDAIRKQDGRWVVVTRKGLIVAR